MKFLIAPDKFKDSLEALGVAAALGEGVCAGWPEAEVELCPMGDGGEGTGKLLACACGAKPCSVEALDPLGRVRTSQYWMETDARRAIVEMAEASGLCLLREDERDAVNATSYGTGQIIREALEAGRREITLCVGGSATVDGGAGCLQGMGWRFYDYAGRLIERPLTGRLLGEVMRVEGPDDLPRFELEILCDVTNPLLGENGAAGVYGPQKGAAADEVLMLEEHLRHWADLLVESGAEDLRDMAGAGAAGGLPLGLASAAGARMVRGIEYAAERLKLRDKILASDFVFTGEGRLDSQTASGKTIAGVARLASEAGKPATAFVGAAALNEGECLEEAASALGLRDIVVITPAGASLAEALGGTWENLEAAAENYVRHLRERG